MMALWLKMEDRGDACVWGMECAGYENFYAIVYKELKMNDNGRGKDLCPFGGMGNEGVW